MTFTYCQQREMTILLTKRNELVHNLKPTHVQFAIIVTAWHAKVQNFQFNVVHLLRTVENEQKHA